MRKENPRLLKLFGSLTSVIFITAAAAIFTEYFLKGQILAFEPARGEYIPRLSDNSPKINQTTSGPIEEDEIWRGEILITGDIQVLPGVTLTIEPGTTVRFTAFSDDRSGGPNREMGEWRVNPDPTVIPASMICLGVDGALIAKGTKDAPITFTSDSANPKTNDWQSIAVNGFAKIVFEYCNLEYCYWGIQLNSQEPEINFLNSNFCHIATGGIIIGTLPGRLLIKDCAFSDCGHEGLAFEGHVRNAVVQHCILENSFCGIVSGRSEITIKDSIVRKNKIGLNVSGNLTIQGNLITQNYQHGILIGPEGNPVITGNNIYNNSRNLSGLKRQGSVEAKNNWWGTTNPGEIRRLNNSDPSIIFEPFAFAPLNLDVPQ